MDADPERVSAEGARQGVFSFGYFSLHKQRSASQQPKADQSNSPQGESFALALVVTMAELCGFSRGRTLSETPGRG
ncbi:hypothetical protein [Xanthomonas sp. NCPPB 1128]|uniref:hypothetical protein n=1 Tax=Xanthomonas sp. NCPPB 1128 TaxID=1775876 RepID=UPI00103D0EFD|nr:hypothetical protein [Xanthomonas sp. NCPPB 1128]